MVFQAYLVLAFTDLVLRKVELACPQLYITFYKIQQLPHLAHRSKGSQVFGAVIDLEAGEEYTGKRFIANDDIRVGLVVLQIDVELGLVLLDERVLQQKSILFRIHDSELDASDVLHQLMCLIGGKGLCKIRAHPFAKALRLANVDQLVLFVEVFIYARIYGYRVRYIAELFLRHSLLLGPLIIPDNLQLTDLGGFPRQLKTGNAQEAFPGLPVHF